MCVGGVVIEVSDAVNGRRRISVAEKRAGGGLDLFNATAVWVEDVALPIGVSDSLWWQAGKAYWTSHDGTRSGSMKKLGPSFRSELATS